MYKFHNANVHDKFVNDCVIRAISVAENKTWDETYNKLSEMAQMVGTLLDDSYFVDSYLSMNYEKENHNSITIREFIDTHPKGTYLITLTGHITVVRDGVLYDTFDCRDRYIKDAWFVSY